MATTDLIKQYASDLEIEGELEPDSPGIYTLALEDDINVKITVLPQGFSLFAAVIACPQSNKEQFLSQALLANLFGQGTRGSVLGTTDDGNLLTLSKLVEYNVDYKDFRETLEDFVIVIDFWREQARTHK